MLWAHNPCGVPGAPKNGTKALRGRIPCEMLHNGWTHEDMHALFFHLMHEIHLVRSVTPYTVSPTPLKVVIITTQSTLGHSQKALCSHLCNTGCPVLPFHVTTSTEVRNEVLVPHVAQFHMRSPRIRLKALAGAPRSNHWRFPTMDAQSNSAFWQWLILVPPRSKLPPVGKRIS